MTKIKIKISRENKDGVERSVVLVDERNIPFGNGDDCNIYVESDIEYGITVYCEGPVGANSTVSVERASGKVIDPLKVTINNPYGVSHSSDVFKVSAA